MIALLIPVCIFFSIFKMISYLYITSKNIKKDIISSILYLFICIFVIPLSTLFIINIGYEIGLIDIIPIALLFLIVILIESIISIIFFRNKDLSALFFVGILSGIVFVILGIVFIFAFEYALEESSLAVIIVSILCIILTVGYIFIESCVYKKYKILEDVNSLKLAIYSNVISLGIMFFTISIYSLIYLIIKVYF